MIEDRLLIKISRKDDQQWVKIKANKWLKIRPTMGQIWWCQFGQKMANYEFVREYILYIIVIGYGMRI
jgi:hypothetical protein